MTFDDVDSTNIDATLFGNVYDTAAPAKTYLLYKRRSLLPSFFFRRRKCSSTSFTSAAVADTALSK